MKFVAKVQFSAEIKNFERFDYSDFEYVDFSNEMKNEISKKFDMKKFRLLFDLANVDPNGDGFTVHATASHRKKSTFSIQEKEDGIFYLLGEAEVSVPLRVSGIEKRNFCVSIIGGDLWKGAENEVKLILSPINDIDFNLVAS